MPTVRGWALLGAGLALLFLWWLFGDPELLLVGVFLLLATALALLYVHYHRPSLSVARHLSGSAVHNGDTTTVTLTLQNRGRRAIGHLFLNDVVEQLGTAAFEIAAITPGELATAAYRVTCRPRGVYQVGPARGTVTDPLALAELPVPSGVVDRLVVYPTVEDLSGFPIVSGKDPSLNASRPEHSQRGGEDFYTLREYQRGDDLRRVHWPSSAKTDELMIRQLETPWQSRALVLLDVRESPYESEEAFETAVSGAASVVTHLVRSGFDADLWAGEADTIDAARYAATMERLALVEPDPSIDIEAVGTRVRHRGGGGALVMITGVPDRKLLSVQRLLAADFGATLLMGTTSTTPQTVIGFHRVGATTVLVEPGGRWSRAWLTAMRSKWASVSAV
ncbi:MAG: DUF58 domain-containing protein [Actinobacteria bacterium]|nr:DUF58 domain-containing protein [Actinomycetota bacterium]